MKKLFLLSIFALVFAFTASGLCYAKSVETRIFLKDVKRCQKFIDKQYDLLMQFFDSLTPEGIEALNSGKYKIEIFNPKAISILKKLKKMGDGPRKVKGWGGNHMPFSFLSHFQNICDYNEILTIYRIPEEEHEEVLNKYAEYSIFLLNKLQELREKTEDIGLEMKIDRFPTINGIIIHGGILVAVSPASDHDTSMEIVGKINHAWRMSTKKMPELFSNKNVLTAQKHWYAFVLDNDFAGIREEQCMKELDKIEKRLAKMSNTPKKKQESAKETIDKSEPSQKTSPPDKPKFKLDLPK
jgi:hypothetical protein